MHLAVAHVYASQIAQLRLPHVTSPVISTPGRAESLVTSTPEQERSLMTARRYGPRTHFYPTFLVNTIPNQAVATHITAKLRKIRSIVIDKNFTRRDPPPRDEAFTCSNVTAMSCSREGHPALPRERRRRTHQGNQLSSWPRFEPAAALSPLMGA